MPRVYPRVCGGTRDATREGGANKVYPRVCGGTALTIKSSTGGYGLSPRVRGNQRRQRGVLPRHRSIPACAGEPKSPAKTLLDIKVYPRVCGGTLL